jgi:hypothetical protein
MYDSSIDFFFLKFMVHPSYMKPKGNKKNSKIKGAKAFPSYSCHCLLVQFYSLCSMGAIFSEIIHGPCISDYGTTAIARSKPS